MRRSSSVSSQNGTIHQLAGIRAKVHHQPSNVLCFNHGRKLLRICRIVSNSGFDIAFAEYRKEGRPD